MVSDSLALNIYDFEFFAFEYICPFLISIKTLMPFDPSILFRLALSECFFVNYNQFYQGKRIWMAIDDGHNDTGRISAVMHGEIFE
jgi:hypothetical protein